MSTVVPFRQVDRIVIDTGIVKAGEPELIGRRVYWLEFFDADGGRLVVWQGTSLAEGRRAAAAWAAGGALISDRSGMS